MTLPNELHPGFLASAGGSGDLGDTIAQSLRFKHGHKIERNLQTQFGSFSSTATLSFWIKFTNRLSDSTSYAIWRADNVGAAGADRALTITREGGIKVSATGNTSPTESDAKLKDPSAWYHFMIIADSSSVKFYVNGSNIFTNSSGWSAGTNAYSDTMKFQTLDEVANTIEYYLAEVNFLDGTKATVGTDFGRANEDGVWVPVAPSFTAAQYGTNGFRLTFDSSQTNAGIVEDSAPIGASGHTARNDFTATGFDTSDLLFRSQDVYGDTSTTYDSNNTNKIFLPDGVSYGPIKMFDGDLVNDACKSGTGQAQTWIYWRPSGGLSISSSLVVHCSNTADVRINGTSTGQTNDGQASNFPITIANPPSTLTELAIQGNSISSATIYGVVVDGTTLTENRDNDVDYFDTPTSNYPTINSAYPVSNPPQNAGHKEANLGYTGSANLWSNGASTMKLPSTGEYYWEHELVLHSDHQYFGVTRMPILTYGSDTGYISFRAYHDSNWYVYQDSSLLQTGTWKCCTGNIISQAYNIDTGVYRVWIDGSLVATNTWSNRPTDEDLFIFGSLESKTSNEFRVNYGQRPFLLASYLGFGDTNKLLSNNTPEPTIKDARDHFESVIWAGNDTDDRNITTTNGFAPDLVWIKSRSAGNHGLFDTIRGATKRIMSNYANAEDTQANDLQAFNTDGFQVGTQARVNASGQNYVAWCWKAGETFTPSQTGGITNLAGSRNTDAGFSIVKYTGSNSAATIGHGLNSAPEMIIIKNRDDSANWIVYHKDINPAGAPEDWYMMLHVADQRTLAGDAWGSTAPGSSVFNVGAFNNTNGSGDDLIAYCWHSVESYSKIGYYVGNNASSGPFVYTGFSVGFVMIKAADSAQPWFIWDTSRSPENPTGKPLRPNDNVLEDDFSSVKIDILSNGFKLQNGHPYHNGSGTTYLYMAFASNPFGGQNVPPATAR